MTTKPLEEFEKLNTTTESIYDLEGLDVLIILEDGTNLTSWEDVEHIYDVIYVSEDLSDCDNLDEKYAFMTSLRAIVATGVSDNLTSMKETFHQCESLTVISSLAQWVVSNVESMYMIFRDCKSLRDISPLKDWDVSKVCDMASLFGGCHSLCDISPLKEWNTSNAGYMGGMFWKCKSLTDISPLRDWDVSNT